VLGCVENKGRLEFGSKKSHPWSIILSFLKIREYLKILFFQLPGPVGVKKHLKIMNKKKMKTYTNNI